MIAARLADPLAAKIVPRRSRHRGGTHQPDHGGEGDSSAASRKGFPAPRIASNRGGSEHVSGRGFNKRRELGSRRCWPTTSGTAGRRTVAGGVRPGVGEPRCGCCGETVQRRRPLCLGAVRRASGPRRNPGALGRGDGGTARRPLPMGGSRHDRADRRRALVVRFRRPGERSRCGARWHLPDRVGCGRPLHQLS
jgi:hypothetical protein